MNKIYVFERACENGSILYLTQDIFKVKTFKKKHPDYEYFIVEGKEKIRNFLLDFQLQEINFLDIIIL